MFQSLLVEFDECISQLTYPRVEEMYSLQNEVRCLFPVIREPASKMDGLVSYGSDSENSKNTPDRKVLNQVIYVQGVGTVI